MIYKFLNDEYSVGLIKKLKLYSLEYNFLILEAMKFSKAFHINQNRKSGEPYYMHPVAVAMLVLDFTRNPETIAAALLHDTLEDTAATYDMLQEHFGDRVASIVYMLTRDRHGREKLSLEEILDYIIMTNDYDAGLIKLMDRFHNLSTIEIMKEKKIIETMKETYRARFIGLAAEISLDIEKSFILFLEKYNNTLIK
jgi:(p)ppGpp synthase/HD superfamily hydrolase